MAEFLLDVDSVTMQFGGVTALEDVSLRIKPGEILGLIGPNGAGKTTMFNVVTGVYQPTKGDIRFDGQSVVGVKRHHITKRAMELLTFMGIADYAEVAARNLPYGYQRRLEIARALGTEPKLLCLDEPAAGFNPAEKQELNELIFKIRDQGYTVLLIEHDMKVVMGVSDHVVVLDFGRKIAEGRPEVVRENPDVIAAYLGVTDDAS